MNTEKQKRDFVTIKRQMERGTKKLDKLIAEAQGHSPELADCLRSQKANMLRALADAENAIVASGPIIGPCDC